LTICIQHETLPAVPIKSTNSFPEKKVMIEITQKAAVMLKEFLKDLKVSGKVRIFLQKSS